MNQFGSYRALLGNANAALAAGIEIFNKPRIDYREECAVVLIVNAWELALKAVLSKRKVRIFYPKRRSEPYRTYSIRDAIAKAAPYFPPSIDHAPCALNIEVLADYRDNIIHFYNEPGFGVLVYALLQTAITNYRDLVVEEFQRDIASDMTIALLPLALTPPVDPIAFLKSATAASGKPSAGQEFARRLRDYVVQVEESGRDTGRLMTVFSAKLISTKKIEKADLIVGVQGGGADGTPVVVQKRVDPNESHPFREKDIVLREKAGQAARIEVVGTPITQHMFRALGQFLNAKANAAYCWEDKSGAVTRYSPAYLDRLRAVTPGELAAALSEYASRPRSTRKK